MKWCREVILRTDIGQQRCPERIGFGVDGPWCREHRDYRRAAVEQEARAEA